VYEADINDPLSTVCDPTGFPRQVLYETRPFQVVQTPNQVLICSPTEVMEFRKNISERTNTVR